MTWLVTGAAGYIGAHVVRRLHAAGKAVVAVDDLSNGDCARLPGEVPLIVADVNDVPSMTAAMRQFDVTGVMHLAGVKSAPESVRRPMYYYRHNVGGVVAILEAMADVGVRRLVFSSSAAVYGKPDRPVVDERSTTRPLNPYGQSKLAAENLIAAAGAAFDLSWVVLRYFNAVGAGVTALGDRGNANLLPLAFRAVRSGIPLAVTGHRLATPDGTGIRDYVHVSDVAEAHLVTAGHLDSRGGGAIYNVGAGCGHSVREVISAVRTVTGSPVPYRLEAPRPGDPPAVVADIAKIYRDTGWRPQHDLLTSVASAWLAWPGSAAAPNSRSPTQVSVLVSPNGPPAASGPT